MDDLNSRDRLEETKRTSRILELIQMIAQRPHVYRRAALAKRFEVTERMITNDLQIIREGLKLPLLHDNDGYYFERLPLLPTTGYSFTEGLALLNAARIAQTMPGVNSAELAVAIARLETLFPPQMRLLLREATERLPVSAQAGQRQVMLTILHRSWLERRQVRITYATGYRDGEINERTVDPYSIIPYGRSWQLIGYCHLREDVLQFKVDRVRGAILLDQHYEVPEDWDVDTYLGSAWGIMRGEAGDAERVVLQFDGEAGRWVIEEQWHPSQQSEVLPDGTVRITYHVGITSEMVGWLLSYGSRVRILEPAWLASRVRDEHRRAAE